MGDTSELYEPQFFDFLEKRTMFCVTKSAFSGFLKDVLNVTLKSLTLQIQIFGEELMNKEHSINTGSDPHSKHMKIISDLSY